MIYKVFFKKRKLMIEIEKLFLKHTIINAMLISQIIIDIIIIIQ